MSGTLGDLLHQSCILPRLQANSSKHVLVSLAESLANALKLDRDVIIGEVMERERLGSTGVGEGVAIPHARIAGLTAPVGGFAKLVTPVDFEALDEQPCDLVFMLLAPKESSADHLRALARISRVFRQARLRQAIREAPNSKDALIALLTQPLQSDAA